MDDELSLLARARALEEEALAEVHHRYYQSIFRYVSFRVGDTAVAEDLTSDVFTRLLDALRDKTAPQNTLRGWLFRVAAHVVADHYRRRERANEVGLSETMVDDRIAVDEEVNRSLRAAELRAALQELTADQQRVLSLRFGAGMRIREVAGVIEKSEGAVKQLQLRAIAALAKRLAPGAKSA